MASSVGAGTDSIASSTTTIRIPSCVLQTEEESNSLITSLQSTASSSTSIPAGASSTTSICPSSPATHISSAASIKDEVTRVALTSASSPTRRDRESVGKAKRHLHHHNKKKMTEAASILEEDVTLPSFFCRNLSSLKLDLTNELRMKVGDAEHIIRGQCMFFTSLLFRLLQHKTYVASRPFCIAVVGCGPIGRLLVGSFLAMHWPSESLLLVTRDISKAKDFRAQGVHCTERHEALSGVPLVILAVSPVHLRDLTEQLEEDVLKKEQLVISTLVGVTLERLCKVLGHDLVLRTCLDVRKFPLSWKTSSSSNGTTSTLNHNHKTEEINAPEDNECFYHAARHLHLSLNGGSDVIRKIFTALGERQKLSEAEAIAIVDDAINHGGDVVSRRPSNHSSTSVSHGKSYLDQPQFEELDRFIKEKILPPFSVVFTNAVTGDYRGSISSGTTTNIESALSIPAMDAEEEGHHRKDIGSNGDEDDDDGIEAIVDDD